MQADVDAAAQEQQRAFSAVIVPAAVDPASPVAEETLLAWYEENTSDYLSEEQVLIEYLELIGWRPDILVGSLIAGLFLHSAIDVLRRSLKAWRTSGKSSVTVELKLDPQQRR